VPEFFQRRTRKEVDIILTYGTRLLKRSQSERMMGGIAGRKRRNTETGIGTEVEVTVDSVVPTEPVACLAK
jgi:hypothetical protein